jgi:transcriptional regulator with XRE-family HTH domain
MRTALKMWLVQNKKKAGEVASELGVTSPYFSQIISGNKNPSMELLDKFYELYSNTEGAENIYELFRKR